MEKWTLLKLVQYILNFFKFFCPPDEGEGEKERESKSELFYHERFRDSFRYESVHQFISLDRLNNYFLKIIGQEQGGTQD